MGSHCRMTTAKLITYTLQVTVKRKGPMLNMPNKAVYMCLACSFWGAAIHLFYPCLTCVLVWWLLSTVDLNSAVIKAKNFLSPVYLLGHIQM